MRKILAIVFVLIAGTASASDNMALRNFDIGDPYQPFCGSLIEGNELCSSEFEGKVLVASFVRIGQVQSDKVLIALQKLSQKHKAQNVSIVGIISGDVNLQELTDFTKKHNITIPIILDSNRALYGKFGIFVYPSSAVFGPDKILRYIFGSNTINISKRFEGAVRYLLGEISQDELGRILHPVVEKIDRSSTKMQRYYNFARKSFEKQQLSRAKKLIKLSFQKYPDHALSHSLYGKILLVEKKCDLALEQFDKALELDPTIEEAKVGRKACLEK